ncbi:MAG TPA: rod shape-determining protein RodA [Stellaceae bacterium]|nr:rod shape-determining protein RodA [Stellaceae bacterium]
MANLLPEIGRREQTILEKARNISWGLIALICIVAMFGVGVLYSAADGNMQPWSEKQILRFSITLVPMMVFALLDIRYWFRTAYWIYAAVLALVVAVDLRGFVGMGAQRWIDLGVIQLQPSELMNVALVLALARYFHGLTNEDLGRIRYLIAPAAMVLLPAALVLKQPDLGTAIVLLLCSAVMFFVAGVRLRLFMLMAVAAGAAIPLAWRFLRDYQKNRIYTFLDPDSDPLGAGYHILQSKIALGSGGLFGKGFLLGTQSHLNFLPEKQTDFIFTTLAEEFGFIGSMVLLAIYSLIIIYCFAIALRSANHFGRLLGLGIATNFFLYVFVNTAMVMGIIPVVGVPLPLISYGGTAMLAAMFGFGLLVNVGVHREVRLNRSGDSQPG